MIKETKNMKKEILDDTIFKSDREVFQPRASNKSLRTDEQVIELKNAATEKRLRKNALRLKNYKRND